jgi:hypothetical protein
MPNKRTYVTILRRISDVDDTVLHYYSDDGLNWSEWYHIYYPAGDEIWQTEVLMGTELEFVIMVIAVSCVKLLSAHNSTQHTSRKHKV